MFGNNQIKNPEASFGILNYDKNSDYLFVISI